MGLDHALGVEHHQTAVDRVEAVDVLQHRRHGRTPRLPVVPGQGLAQHRRQGPPAAVVGALVEVAVEDVAHQPAQLLGPLAPARQRGVADVLDGLLHPGAGAHAGLGHLAQHGVEPQAVVMLAARHQAAVPDHPAQVAVDRIGVVTDGQQLGIGHRGLGRRLL
jgi:hypothetical protein